VTRKEFAKLWSDHWTGGGYMKADQTMIEATTCFNLNNDMCRSIAEVATNGFTPEQEDDGSFTFTGKLVDYSFLDSPKPPARPFIGSHNLPYDSDWDG